MADGQDGTPLAAGVGGNVVTLDLTARRMTSRAGFMPLYREGFAILEDAAAYMGEHPLGAGRLLSRRDAIAYTLETCKLTTAAIRLAAWMMMQRAVVEGEVSAQQLAGDPDRPTIDAVELPDPQRVPEGLRDVVGRLRRFTARMQLMDGTLYGRRAG